MDQHGIPFSPMRAPGEDYRVNRQCPQRDQLSTILLG